MGLVSLAHSHSHSSSSFSLGHAKHHGGHLTILVFGGCDRDRGGFRTHSRSHQNQIQIRAERTSFRRWLFALHLILLLIISTPSCLPCEANRTPRGSDIITTLTHYYNTKTILAELPCFFHPPPRTFFLSLSSQINLLPSFPRCLLLQHQILSASNCLFAKRLDLNCPVSSHRETPRTKICLPPSVFSMIQPPIT